MQLEWWMRSPSPMTLTFWSLLALYGAYRLQSKTTREWITNFAESALLIGIVILPYDSSWQIFQWIRWGYLHPEEYIMVIGVLIRNAAIFALCALSSWKLGLRTQQLKLTNATFIIFTILTLAAKFLYAPDIVWTDWTYGIRFEENPPWLLAYLSGIPDKIAQAVVYVALWKGSFLDG